MPGVTHGSSVAAVEEAARTIEAQFAVAMGSDARVAAACAELRDARASWSEPPIHAELDHLATLLVGRVGPLVPSLFDLLEEVARTSPHPWALLAPMLRAGPPELVVRALDALLGAIDQGRLRLDDDVMASIAAIADAADSPLLQRPSLDKLARLLGTSARRRYVGSPDAATRRLAARVLDLSGRLPTRSTAAAVLGDAGHRFLAPYLEFTRATHVDLLAFTASGATPAQATASLQAAEHACGAPLVREVIATVGWSAVNLGLEARRLVGVSIGRGLPLVVSPDEAALFAGCPCAERVFERTLFLAHGTRPTAAGGSPDADAGVARFRAYNLNHARLLAAFLDLAPLTADRADRLITGVGDLVADFVGLFATEREECRRVQAAYGTLTAQIADARSREGGPGLPAEVTRLVQPFEDPASPEAVRTLHGLKRYLHQRGLRLGLRLAQSERHATRTVSIALSDGEHVAAARPIEYADFDPDPASPAGAIPYGVRVVVEAFARQLVHGEDKLPIVRVFCYGNEVHYFISFRNHPAFARIDYSPPFAGGMVDLEYFGVSKYELSHHPNLSLDAVRQFFRRLDFDITIENTRIHVRYDKERARDVADLCARADMLFRLAPYLMDLDWVLGNLDLPRDGREVAARAWADRFARWGVLPLRQVLRADGRGVLLRDLPHPAGPRERTWEGDPPYRDRLTPDDGAEAEAAAWIRNALSARGLGLATAFGDCDLAQLPFEAAVLGGLHDARAARQQDHDATRLATVVSDGGPALVDAARTAAVLSPVDRFLQFDTIGHVSGRAVQHATVSLPGRRLSIAILRDDAGAPGLAVVDDMSTTGAAMGPTEVAALLRSHNFPTGDVTLPDGAQPVALRRAFSVMGRVRGIRPLEGERLARGVRAAPGVAAGVVRLGTMHRAPADIEGAVLVTDRLSPDDTPFLIRAAGVVCTGGGVLSHAGLLAAQFGRPALVIDARWMSTADAGAPLQFWSVAYNETERAIGPCTVVERRGALRREEWLRDGDLVELNADEGILRVLGQEREALALYDALRRLGAAETRLTTAVAPEQVLVDRGQRAHALHQLQRLVTQIRRADLAAFCVRRLLSDPALFPASADLLGALLDGPGGDAARSCLADHVSALTARFADSDRTARERISRAGDPFEVVALRLAVMRDGARLDAARSMLRATGRAPITELPADTSQGDAREAANDAALARLRTLNDLATIELERALSDERWDLARHILDARERHEMVLGGTSAQHTLLQAARRRLMDRDEGVRARVQERRVLTAADGGAELYPVIGAKAANLAEVGRLAPDVPVPSWFAIGDAAFREALAVPAGDHRGVPASVAIATVLAEAGLDERQRSRAIAAIWEQLAWPLDLAAEICAAYRVLSAAAGPDAPRSPDGELLVAVRSSGFEEDQPEAMRAGEFDTFLCVAGEASLLAHVKRAWSGFWTARAIHHRGLLGLGSRLPGGGILVQQIVNARAAGVVQTINVADARPWELAIDVAFGLGEGVVSGRVAADHVTVVKRERPGAALRFHYATADKRERIVFDAQRGTGTVRADTLYEQRMRPALEYAELETLVGHSERLERDWHEALDIEFAVDQRGVWLLQARPVPAFHAVWRETARHHPLAPGG